ncbi:MAG: hypothetical protein N2Z85_00290 [Patescibacteria group bacterium]|nr:hypothetical protein [Patescibacteria group bacterium]
MVLSFFLIVFSSFAQEGQEKKVPICQLGNDPADIYRRIDWEKESILRPLQQQKVKMTTGSGRVVECILPRLTPVVVEKSTGVARWILGCGNQIISPTKWIPEGIREFPEQHNKIHSEQVVQEIKISPSTLNVEGEIKHGVNVSGEIRHIHAGEIILRDRSENTITPTSQPPKKSWWQKNRKWVIPLTIVGAAAGGYVAARSGGSKTIQYQPLPPPIKR